MYLRWHIHAGIHMTRVIRSCH